MKTAQKVALSLLITVLICAGVTFLAFSGIFDYIETEFYQARIRKQVIGNTEKLSGFLDSYHRQHTEFFRLALEDDFIARNFIPNQSQEDIFNTENRFQSLRREISGLLRIRLVDTEGRIHYSSWSEDFREEGRYRRVYRKLDETGESYQLEDFLLAGMDESRVIYDREDGVIIYVLPVINRILENQAGLGIFYISLQGVQQSLLKGNLLSLGQELAILPEGIVVNISPAEENRNVLDEIAAYWEGEPLSGDLGYLGTDDYGVRYYLASVKTVYPFYTGTVINQNDFILSSQLKYVLLISFYITLFLIVLLVFSLRQDKLVVIADRIKKFQINLMREYMENRNDLDWELWQRDLALKKEGLNKQIKKGLGRLKPDKEKQVDDLLEKSWDEIFSVLGDKPKTTLSQDINAQNLELLISKVLSNPNLVLPTVKTTQAGPDRPAAKIEDLEEIEEIPPLDETPEAGDLEEPEDFEELEEISDAEDLETLEELDDEPEGEIEVIEEIGSIDAADAEDLEELENLGGPEELEEIESLDEAGDMEPLESLDEAGDMEALESLDEAEDMEALESLDEAEDMEPLETLEEPETAEEPEELQETEDLELETLEEAEELGEIPGADEQVPQDAGQSAGLSLEDVENSEVLDLESIFYEENNLGDIDVFDDMEDMEDYSQTESLEELDAEPLDAADAAGPGQKIHVETVSLLDDDDLGELEELEELEEVLDLDEDELQEEEDAAALDEEDVLEELEAYEPPPLSIVPLEKEKQEDLEFLPLLEAQDSQAAEAQFLSPELQQFHIFTARGYGLSRKVAGGAATYPPSDRTASISLIKSPPEQAETDKLRKELEKYQEKGLLEVRNFRELEMGQSSSSNSIEMKKGIFQIKDDLFEEGEYQPRDRDLKELADSIMESEKDEEPVDLFAGESVDLSFLGLTPLKDQEESVPLRGKSQKYSEYGLKFEALTHKMRNSVIKEVKTLMMLSSATDSIMAALLMEKEGQLEIAFSVGFTDSGKEKLKISRNEGVFKVLFEPRKIILIKKLPLGLKELDSKLIKDYRDLLAGALYVPIEIQGEGGYLFFGLKEITGDARDYINKILDLFN